MNGIELLVAFAPRDFRDHELVTAVDVLSRRGFVPLLASTESGVARGLDGMKIEADDLARVDPEGLDATILLGGPGARDHLWEDPNLRRLVQSVDGRGGIVGAGTDAVTVLARAGVLRGREVASVEGLAVESELRHAGAKRQARPLVVSRNIVTLGDPAQARAWVETQAAMLEGLAAAGRTLGEPLSRAS